MAQAKQERETQAAPNNPQLVAARGRLDDVTRRLNEAQATYDREIGVLQGKLDTEQRGFDAAMAKLKQRSDAAGPALEAARKQVAEVEQAFNDLPRAVGFWKKLWWKLAHHFDVDQYWREHGSELRDAMRKG
jgi:hypothetical protein